MIAIPYLSPAIAASGWFKALELTGKMAELLPKLIAGGTVFLGQMFINAILPVPKPDVPELGAGSPTYSWAAQGNIALAGTPCPAMYGTHRVKPPRIDRYISQADDKLYLNMLYLVADHSVDSIYDVRINKTDVSDFSEAKIQIRLGDLQQSAIEWFLDTFYEIPVGIEIPKAEQNITDTYFVQLPEGVEKGPITGARVDTTCITSFWFGMVGYTYHIIVGGELGYWPVDVAADYTVRCSIKKVGDPSWTTKDITERSTGRVTKYFRTVFRSLLSGQYQVKMLLVSVVPVDPPADGVLAASPEFWWEGISTNDFQTSAIADINRNDFDRLVVWISFPSGLYKASFSDTSFSSMTVKIRAEVRADSDPAGEWIGLTRTITEAKNEPFQRDIVFEDLPRDYYTVQVFFEETPPSGVEYVCRAVFDRIQLVTKDDFGYPGASLLAVKALASEHLSGSDPVVDCMAARDYVPVFNGTEADIEGISLAAMPVFTWTAHPLQVGDYVRMDGITQAKWTIFMGWPWKVATIDVNTFTVEGAPDTSAFGAYVPGTDPGIFSHWEPKLASNPAWQSYDMHTNDQYGHGVNKDRMILADFQDWADWCDDLEAYRSKTDEYVFRSHLYMDVSKQMGDWLSHPALLGWGTVCQKGSDIGVLIDKPQEASQMFDMGNIKSGSFKIRYMRQENRTNWVEATYYDENRDYARRMVPVPRQDYVEGDPDQVYLPTQIDMKGCIDRTLAGYHSAHLLAGNQLIKKIVEFEVGVDALGCILMDLATVSHDLPLWGWSGRVVSAAASTVTLDRTLTLQVDVTYYVKVRHQTDVDADGYDDFEVRQTVPVVEETETDTLTLTAPWTNVPIQHAVYEVHSSVAVADFLITKITRTSELERKVTLIEFDEDIYRPDLAISPDPTPSELTLVENLQAIEVFMWQSPEGRSYVYLSWSGRGFFFNVWYRVKDSGSWTYNGNTGNTWYKIYELTPRTTYEFAVSGTGSPDTGETVELFYKGWGTRLPPLRGPSGLRVIDDSTDNIGEWTGIDLHVEWNDTSAYEQPIDTPAGIYPPVWTFTSYRIKLQEYFTKITLMEEIITTTGGKYSYTRNTNDSIAKGFAYPQPDLWLQVWGRTADGKESLTPSKLRCTNPPPAAPANLIGISKIGGVQFTWDYLSIRGYFLRSKVEDDSWSSWIFVETNSYFRHLTAAEIIAHRKIRCTIYIQMGAVDYFIQFSGVEDSGNSTSVGETFLTDTAKSWVVNEWAGYFLVDFVKGAREIISNTANTLTVNGTPIAGHYTIHSVVEANAIANQPFDRYMDVGIALGAGITGTEEDIYDGDLDSGGVTVT
uniref:Putative tail protein n=1 Tax=viral metagenome TaxID=1070528 RepID=A0A6H1ZGN5_9ZZZZ